MDVQAVDLELLDLEVSDHRSPDRKAANGRGAEGTGTNGRCADHGRAKASRSKLHRGPLLPARTQPGKGPRERDLRLFMSAPRLSTASQDGQTDTLVVSRRHPIVTAGPGEHHVGRSALGQSLGRIRSATR